MMQSLRTQSLLTPLLALAAITLARLIAAAVVPVSPDEAYYWVWSRALSPGYYDHPPMVAFWIRAGTLLLGDTPLGIRLLGPVGLLLATLALLHATMLVDLIPNATLTPLTFMLAGVILGRVEYLRRAPAGPAVAPLGPGRGRVHVGAPGAAGPGMRTVL